ncbi:MAG: DinB family protein, partial [Rhodothermales bacterium]
MNAHLESLIEHMRWANARTLENLRDTPVAEAVRLFAHVLTTECLYHARITGQDPWPQDFWPDLSLEQCAALLPQNYERYVAFLNARPEQALERNVRYRNSKGTVFHTAVGEMLTHLALHGEHHRGQIARIVRRAGG